MKDTIRFEFNRHATITTIALVVIFVAFFSITLQIGIERYETEAQKSIEFTEIEYKMVDRYINYIQYGIYGFRMLQKPSVLMSFFHNSSVLSVLEVFVNNDVRLKFFKPEIGAGLFSKGTGGTSDPSWFILVIGTLCVTTWGFFSFRNREYVRYLMNFTSATRVYFGILIARIIIMFLIVLLLFVVSTLLLFLNGLDLSIAVLSGMCDFLLMSFGIWIFFLLISSACGMVDSFVMGGVIVISIWVVLIYFWPEALNAIFATKADSAIKSRYKNEFEKIEILMNFEKMAYEKTKDIRYQKDKAFRAEEEKRLGEQYWGKDFKEIENLDFLMLKQVEKVINEFHYWSIFNPVTWYKSVNNEISSKGYNSYMAIYRENLKHQKGFLRFYLDKRFYENYAKIIPYLPKGANIIQAESSLPKYFLMGIIVNLLLLAAVLVFSLYRFFVYTFPSPEKGMDFSQIDVAVESGKFVTVFDEHMDVKNQLLNGLYGKFRRFGGKFSIDGDSMLTEAKKDFTYVPPLTAIPSALKIKDLMRLAGIHDADTGLDSGKTYGSLGSGEKAFLLLYIAHSLDLKINVIGNIMTGVKKPDDIEKIIELTGSMRTKTSMIGLTMVDSSLLTPDWGIGIARKDNSYQQFKVQG